MNKKKKKNKKRGWIWCVRPRYRNKFVKVMFGWMLPKYVKLLVDFGKAGGVMQRGKFFVNQYNKMWCKDVSFAYLRDIFFFKIEVYRKP
jgi:hypothetical protein